MSLRQGGTEFVFQLFFQTDLSLAVAISKGILVYEIYTQDAEVVGNIMLARLKNVNTFE